MIYNALVCATFGHKGDAQQSSCNLYSIGVGNVLIAAYARVLTSCHAFHFGVVGLSNINSDGWFKFETTFIFVPNRTQLLLTSSGRNANVLQRRLLAL